MKKQNGEISIKDILDIFIPKLWLLAIVAVIGAVAMGFITETKADTYTSTSTFMMVKVPMSNSEATNTGLNTGEITAMQHMIDSAKYILSSETFCKKVRDNLDGYEKVTVGQIRSMLTLSLLGDTTICSVTTRTTDPELSKAVADVVHDIFPEDIQSRLPYAIKITELDPPRKPYSADDKGTLQNAVIGFAAGLLLSALVVFIWAKLDVVIRSKEKIEESLNIPILGTIPKLESDN